jgi:hypothetical protein
MSNNVNISNTTPNSVEVSVDKNIITILQPSGNNQIVVGQTTTNLIEVRTPGPQGPPGQTADISGLLTTASFNQFTASFNTGSFSGSFIGEFSGSGAELSNIPATAIVGLNLSQISSGAYSASISEAGLLVNNRIVADSFTGSLQGTSSWSENAQTALFAPNYLPLTGGTINGNIILNGTASIAFLNVTYESASVIYSSGSNQFGDAINDTQTLIGTVIISGSQRITGSLNAPSITGSLFGTASYANNANLLDGIDSTRFATTGSNTFTSNQIISGTLLVTGHVDGTLLGTASYANNSDLLDGIDSTQFAKTGSNTFVGNQIISGSLIVRENLTVLGSASVTYISESTLNIGTNLITVNTINPGARFGGLAVIDSGSSQQISASFLYDSIKDEFVFVHHSIPTTSSVFLQGPETYNDLGNEIYLTQNRIPKGTGIEHLNDSNISDDGSVVSINSNTQITGSLSQGINTIASGSYSHAEGGYTIAAALSGYTDIAGGLGTQTGFSHAEGFATITTGSFAHSEGYRTNAIGHFSHAEGDRSIALGNGSHAEGLQTISSGQGSHAEGQYTTASAYFSHAEGYQTNASGWWSHAEGWGTEAIGGYSPIVGSIIGAHSEGLYAKALGPASHAEGYNTIASGAFSHAEGQNTQAIGVSSHTEGLGTIASGSYSHAEGGPIGGYNARAEGDYSHAEGGGTWARGVYSHAEGQNVQSIGVASHAEGYNTIASGAFSHAEGNLTIASGAYSHAEGHSTIAIGGYIFGVGLPSGDVVGAHSEGYRTQAIGGGSHAEGVNTIASGSYSHTEGYYTQAIGIASHAEGSYTQAIGDYSHAEGRSTIASGSDSHAEGFNTQALSGYVNGFSTMGSHAEGINTISYGGGSHAEGVNTIASGSFSHAEGSDTTARGPGSHAEGQSTIASGSFSHAEGHLTRAIGNYSHAEGGPIGGYNARAEGDYSHAEGGGTWAQGDYSHAEGSSTQAIGGYSHAEGFNTQAIGFGSHAAGLWTKAIGNASQAIGGYTQALGVYQHVQGKYNVTSSVEAAFIVGNGIDDNNRSNLIFAAGNTVEITGSLNVTSGITGSLLGTASFALSASWAPGGDTFPYIGTAEITGSLLINTGSLNINVVQKLIDLEADIIAFAVAL